MSCRVVTAVGISFFQTQAITILAVPHYISCILNFNGSINRVEVEENQVLND